MELPTEEESKEFGSGPDGSKSDGERECFGCGGDAEGPARGHSRDGAAAPKPGDVRNGDLVSLLLAATPPYLYNIPLIPQTFFFSEMLKSFVHAKTERQNAKAHQGHHRRQRKRSWREATPPKATACETRDRPLELTIQKQPPEDATETGEKPTKKCLTDGNEKKCPAFGKSNFSVEKLANSSVTSESDSNGANVTSGDAIPPAPPLWYPLLYPPHPPYGIDPLHFFIDLRVSAHFWDRKLTGSKLNEETPPPLDLHAGRSAPGSEPASRSPLGRSPHCSAFRVPSPTRPKVEPSRKDPKTKSRNVHYVTSSLRDIYKALEERADDENAGKETEGDKKCKDLRALIGLELVVDYVKQESDGEEGADGTDGTDGADGADGADAAARPPGRESPAPRVQDPPRGRRE